MAVVTFLFSFLARKANDIIQAIFGWSVTALFGRLPKRSQYMVTGALVVSLAWPVFVVGAFVPWIAGWLIAFVPLHKLVSEDTLRVIWIVLAVSAPLLVGALVALAAPHRTGSLGRSLIGGYPMALGFFCAFLVVAVTVPVIKLASIVRRWSDEHIYLQPHEGRYDAVLAQLAEAAARAGAEPHISDAPRYMVLATTIMRTLARGAVTPFVSQTLRRVTSRGLEMYLYPADLLLRGDANTVARVRAMFARTTIDAEAYLVTSEEGQKIQDDLSRMVRILEHDPSQLLVTQLRQTYQWLMAAEIPYDDFVILDAAARRFERALLKQGLASRDWLPLDHVSDHLVEFDSSWRPAEARV